MASDTELDLDYGFVVSTTPTTMKGSCTVEFDRFSKLLHKVGEAAYFSHFDLCGYQWSLFICPFGVDASVQDTVSVCLGNNSDSERSIQLTIALLSSRPKRLEMDSEGTVRIKHGHYYGWQRFVSRAYLLDLANGFIENDRIKFEVSITLSERRSTIKPTVSTDLRTFLMTEDAVGYDVKFSFQNTKVKLSAHRVILAARSPFFNALFNSGMSESVTEEVKVKDVESKVMKELLTFIYTDSFSDECAVNDTEFMKNIFIAACVYDVACARAAGEIILSRQLSVDNVCSLLALADSLASKELKKHCVEFALLRCPRIFLHAEYSGIGHLKLPLAASFLTATEADVSSPGRSKRPKTGPN
jgi:hypothetical protein